MSSIVLSESMNKALKQVSFLLKDLQREWLIGGSSGLILRNIELTAQPRDLDIYVDDPFINKIAATLKPFAMDEPHYSETSIYRSNLSHYLIEGVQVELVGSFSVKSEGSSYHVEVSNMLKNYCTVHDYNDVTLHIMPLAHEFVFNILRKRADRYEIIAKKMKLELEQYIPALLEIIRRNRFSEEHLHQMSNLLRAPLLKGKDYDEL